MRGCGDAGTRNAPCHPERAHGEPCHPERAHGEPCHPERAQRVEGSAPRQFGGPSRPDNRVTLAGVYSPTWRAVSIVRIPPSPHPAMDAEFIALQSALAGEYSLD